MRLGYALRELVVRRNRSIVNVLGIVIAIALFISINSVSSAYREAAHTPLKDIGSDIIIQREGEPPAEMGGTVLPCAEAPLSTLEVDRISSIEGVESVSTALLFWSFDPNNFKVVTGVDPEHPDVGPVKLRSWIKEGNYINPGARGEAVVEGHYANMYKINVGDELVIANRSFSVVGILGVREGSQIAASSAYISLADAQDILGLTDSVNIVFARIDDLTKIEGIQQAVEEAVPETRVTTPSSFMQVMGAMSQLSEKFSLIASLIALVSATIIISKTMAGNIIERTREIGVMKAVGWTNRDIQKQFLAESLIQSFVGGVLGIGLGIIAAYVLGSMQVSIPIPWEASPYPHFMMTGSSETAKQIILPVKASTELLATSLLLAITIGCFTGLALSSKISKMKPAEAIRHE